VFRPTLSSLTDEVSPSGASLASIVF
jgi:hypothetical protein